MDCSPLGSSGHGILQARILRCVAIPFSRGSSRPRDQTWLSCNTGGFSTVGRILYAPSWASLVAQLVKNLPTMWEIWVRSLGWEEPLQEGMASHPSILAWRIPMDKRVHGVTNPWGDLQSMLQSMGSGYNPWGHKELDMTEWLSTTAVW